MRIALSTNAAGDIRLQCLVNKPPIPKTPLAAPDLLVCSSEVAEMTTPVRVGPRPGFGKISDRNSFTRYGKTLVREVGALLDNGPLSCLVFLTGTLPGSTPDAVSALAAWSGWITRAVRQWLLDSASHPQFFGVWEYQKRGALHLHLCVRTQSELEARELKRRWKARWIKLLDSVAKRAGVDIYARADGGTWKETKWMTRTDAQTVERSVARYLSKYLSKGSTTNRKLCPSPPSAWYFCQLGLRRLARAMRRTVEVTSLSLPAAIDLFERLGARLVECVPRAYHYVSPYDVRSKGVVALACPVQASMLQDSIQSVVRVLEARPTGKFAHKISAADKARMVFQVLRDIHAPPSWN